MKDGIVRDSFCPQKPILELDIGWLVGRFWWKISSQAHFAGPTPPNGFLKASHLSPRRLTKLCAISKKKTWCKSSHQKAKATNPDKKKMVRQMDMTNTCLWKDGPIVSALPYLPYLPLCIGRIPVNCQWVSDVQRHKCLLFFWKIF